MIKNRLFLILFRIFILFCLPSGAQFYQTGQDPASLKWKQISTTDFQVVFPEGFENEAQHMANALEFLYNPVSESLHHKPRKISVFLHNNSTYSNGMVAWAPKLMDLYTTPPQDNYAMPWMDQLAVHELRHVVQMDKLNQGITRIASILFGQQALGAIAGLMPRWFFEGDAVNTETALTSSGRGRTGSFNMEMKALVVSRDSLFSYEKALRGSYKDYIPDPYHLGYPMVAWTRKNFGADVFSNAIDKVAQEPFMLFPFPASIRKQTGLPLRKLYKATYTDLKQQWQTTPGNENFQTWNKSKKRAFTSYQFPKSVNDSTLLVVKSGMDQLTEFVLLTRSGKETRVHRPGNYIKDQFSYASGKFCWAEQISDVRWSNRMFSCIKTGDLKTGKVKMLTKRSRYFAPVLSPDAKRIATVEISLQNESFLVILDAEKGKVLDRFAAPSGQILQYPSWSKDGSRIVAVSTGKSGMQLQSFNLSGNTWTSLTRPAFANLSYPTDDGNQVLFVSDQNGTDNIYSISGNDFFRLTDVKFGVSSPDISPNGNIVYFSKYSSQGFDVVSTSFSQKTVIANLRDIKDISPRLYEASSRQENFNYQQSTVPEKEFEVRNYSKIGHMLNVHSWAPFYYDYSNLTLSNNTISPGLMLLSQDKLGTMLSSFGYAYINGFSYFKTDLTYQGIYPVIDFSLSYGGTIPITSVKGVQAPAVSGSGINLRTRVYLPLDFTRGVYVKGITPSVSWEYQNEVYFDAATKAYAQGNSFLTYSFDAYVYMRQSLRDLAPRFGTIFNGGYMNSPFQSKNLFASMWYMQDRLYLPGLLRHHSLQLTVGYQEQLPAFYNFTSSFLAFPRGYTTATTNKITSLRSTYALPLFYPDLALGPVFYLKRIRMNLFYDYSNIGNTYPGQNNSIIWHYTTLSSSGIDLLGDFHVLRILFPLQAGVRIAYLPERKQFVSQFLLNIDLSYF